MTRIIVTVFALLTMVQPSIHGSGTERAWGPPSAYAQSAPAEQTVDTPAAARTLIPLLNSVKTRLRPRVGVTGGGDPQSSPFTGTMTTAVSVGIGKRNATLDPKVAKAMEQLLAWKIDDSQASTEGVLFGHWLSQLSVKAAAVGLLNCDAACLVAQFPKPDTKFGKSRHEREETRDQLLLDALTDAVEEIEP